MTTALFIKYLHILFVLILVSSVFTELILIKKKLNRRTISLLAKLDAGYGLASIAVVGLGLALWFGLGKPAEFYSDNPIFWLKVSLAILLGLLSIYPTVYFIKNRTGNQNDEIQVKKWVLICIYIEVGVLVVIPLLAVFMANGVGL
ncbi:MAG: DUF2214 family protein [Bacteroidia bacterium]